MGYTVQLPLVTVITPAYNRETLLEKTIQSVLAQDYPRIEYIVLDDGSTDGTLNVMKQYADKIRLDSHENMGETRTVNKGFSMAQGEIIGVVNSDDPLLQGAISAIVQHFIDDPEVLVAYPDWNMVDQNGELVRHYRTYDYDYINMLRWHYCMPGPGAFFRKEVVEKLQGRDTQFRYIGDYDFWLRAGLIGKFTRVPETLATFRTHPGSATVSETGEKMAKEHLVLMDKIYSLPNLPQAILEVKREAYSSAHFVAGVSCGEESTKTKRKHYLMALLCCPSKYLSEYQVRLHEILPTLFPGIPLSFFLKLIRLMSIPKRVFRRLIRLVNNY